MYFDKFSNKASELFLIAQKEAESLGHSKIDAEHLLLGMLKETTSVIYELLTQNYGINYLMARERVIRLLGRGARNLLSVSPQISEKLRILLELSFEEAKMYGQNHISIEHIFLAILRDNSNNAIMILNDLDLDPVSLGRDVQSRMSPAIMDDRKNSSSANQIILKQFDEFGENLNELARSGNLDPVIGRDVEIERVMSVLARRKKNNPVLIGEPGVGKTAIVEGLAQRIIKQEVPEVLKNKIIFSLDIASLVAGTKYRGEFEKRLKKLLLLAKQEPNIIIFIDEIHTIVGAGAAEGAVDASNIMKPALASGALKCVGATTTGEYMKFIEKDPGLERRFQKIFVREPDQKESYEILLGLKERYENFHKVHYTEEALRESIKMSKTYISEHFLPDMAIDVIDEAGAKKRLNSMTVPKDLKELEDKIQSKRVQIDSSVQFSNFKNEKLLRDEERELVLEYNKKMQEWRETVKDTIETITEEDVARVISNWTGIPLTRIEEDETKKLLNLEKVLHQRIVGQEEAITSVSRSIRRARSGIKDPDRPVGTFLFLGPTGVGKTELAKTLAEYLFGDEKTIVRFDMSEYMERFAVSRLIGAPPGYIGYEEGGTLTEAIRRRPFSVILLDEIEKAHPDVFNILLQIMDEGRLTDTQGKAVDFRNCILIMTSNIGGEIINRSKHTMGFSTADTEDSLYKEMKKTVTEEMKKVFRPEFLNRLDESIVFHQLSPENIRQIIDILINKVGNRLLQKEISIEIREGAKKFLIEKGFDKIYGARPLKRAIQTYLEDPLAEEILKKTFDKKDTVIVNCSEEGKLYFRKKIVKRKNKKEVALTLPK